MTEDAFLLTIAENPDDDVTRLVNADWLDERGDPRGLIVRTEAEMNTAVRAGHPDCTLERARRKWAYRGWRRRYP
jgi:uncharacterized protein (TIGR02996 family)